MNIDIPHPVRLAPGDRVGTWRILEVLGAGGMGRVFKVESEGRIGALKMALRPPGETLPGEEDVDGWCLREATSMMQHTPHPNIPRLFQVGRWPDPESGYLYLVMEYVDGWRFHDWRYETHPSAAQFVEVLLPIVRTVADLHKRGIHHRDLNADNIHIRRSDGRPFLLDFGSVSLPGARTLTQGIPPVNLAVVPPEALEHSRLHGEHARFQGGPTADLYGIGVLMYQALADGYPFNPALPPERLLAAITLHMPRPPHRVNPHAPKSLSAITMRLLAKHPSGRFESAESLYRALWDASKERTSREWKVALDLPGGEPAPVTDEEMQERKQEEEKARHAARSREQDGGEAPPDGSTNVPPAEESITHEEAAPASPTRPLRPWWSRGRRPLLSVACVLLIGGATLAWWSTMRPRSHPEVAPPASVQPARAEAGWEVAPPTKPPEARSAADAPEEMVSTPAAIAARVMPSEDPVSVKTLANVQSQQPSTTLRAARRVVGAAITCSALTGCPGAQVRPAPPPEACPEGAVEAMAKLGIRVRSNHIATFEFVGQNPHPFAVREGRISVFTAGDWFGMPSTTTLSGNLIFGERIYGRLTEARVNDQTIPVCIEMQDVEGGRGMLRERESDGGPDTAWVLSTVRLRAVSRFE